MDTGQTEENQTQDASNQIALPQNQSSRRLVVSNHVLLMNTVAENLAKCCDAESLRQFRLVCRQWHKSSLEHWPNKTCVILRGNLASFVSFFFNPYAELKLPISNFEAALELSCTVLSYENRLKFSKFKIKTGQLAHSTEDMMFWKEFGPDMKELCLENCAFPSFLLKNILHTHLTRVTKLVVVNCNSDMNNWNMVFDDMVLTYSRENIYMSPTVETLELSGEFSKDISIALFRTCPNIKSLTVNRFGHSDFLKSCNTFIGTITSHREIKQHVNLLSRLPNLTDIKPENFPKLRILSIRLDVDDSFERLKRYFNRRLAVPLEKLTLWRYPLKNCDPLHEFPSSSLLPNLKELTLNGNVVRSFDFLGLAPYLESLKINLLCYKMVPCVNYLDGLDPKGHYQKVFKEGPKYCRKINQNPALYYMVYTGNMVSNSELQSSRRNSYQHFAIKRLYIDYKFDKACLRTLYGWMPNLTELETMLDNTTFPLVCAKWKNLQLLNCLFGSTVNDAGVICFLANFQTQEFAKGLREKGPTLNCLQDLKIFKLDTICDIDRLSDATAHNFFTKLKSLKTLEISAAEFNFSVMNTLRLNLETVKVQNDIHKHNEYRNLQCCKQKRFVRKVGIWI